MSKDGSLVSSRMTSDQTDFQQMLQRDAEVVLGCAVEIDNLIDYFQGSHPQLVTIGLNKFFSIFNQSNALHLSIKQQQEQLSTSSKSSVLTTKNQLKTVTLDIQKDIINPNIQQTLNLYIDKNLAEFNVGYQQNLLELDSTTSYSKELLQDIFYSDEKIQDQFTKRKYTYQQQSFLQRSMTIQQLPTMKDIILEKIEYRKVALLNKLEHRFPKSAHIEPILPYILGLYLFVDSEGYIGDFIEEKVKLKAIDADTLNQSFKNLIFLLQSDYLRLLVTFDRKNFNQGNFSSQTQVQLDKIVLSKKWIDYDKLLLQQLLFSSSEHKIHFVKASNQINQFKENCNIMIEKVFEIFQELKSHETGNPQRNYQKIEKMINEFEQKLKEILTKPEIDILVKNAIRQVIRQLLAMIENIYYDFKSKTGLSVLLKLKLIFQGFIERTKTYELTITCKFIQVIQLQQQIKIFFKNIRIFEISELISKILEANNNEIDFEAIIGPLKYSDNIIQIKNEITLLKENLLENQVIKRFLNDLLEYLNDKRKKKDVQLNHLEVSLNYSDKEVLSLINDKALLSYIAENKQLFSTIYQYIVANDPFKKIQFKNIPLVSETNQISVLSLKFTKNSTLYEFFQLFKDFSTKTQSQLQLQTQLTPQEISDWRKIAQMLI